MRDHRHALRIDPGLGQQQVEGAPQFDDLVDAPGRSSGFAATPPFGVRPHRIDEQRDHAAAGERDGFIEKLGRLVVAVADQCT